MVGTYILNKKKINETTEKPFSEKALVIIDADSRPFL